MVRTELMDEEVDLLVFGAGAAGMTAALTASIEGLKVVLCEKTDMVGGMTASSGGTTWIPGTRQSKKAGVPDTLEAAATFLKSVVAERGGEDLRAAFLASGPEAVDMLEKHTAVTFTPAEAHPDYIDGPGAAYGGRALTPNAFDGKLLGADFSKVRPPHKVFMGLGGMMVGRGEIASLLNPFKSIANFKTTLSVVLPYFLDRLRFPRGSRWLMGNALAGRLYYSLKQRGVPVYLNSPLKTLIVEGGKVIGAIVDTPQGEKRILARNGVVVATGGIGWSTALRERFFPKEVSLRSQTPTGNTGDGISIVARDVAGRLENGCDSPALWMPCSIMKRNDGSEAVWPHIILDRAKPGLLAVGKHGNRFVNESDSYHDFCVGMIKAGLSEAWLIVDDRFIRQYGLGLILPGAKGLSGFIRNGYITSATSVSELAEKIGVEKNALMLAVEKNNLSVAHGIDTEFNRGTSVMNRFNGDNAAKPNPCLGPIKDGPFYALKVVPLDLAGSAGIACNEFGQVLSEEGHVTEGLYACGNDMTSLFRGTYPGPGTTIGPAIVFGYRVARHAAGKL